MVIYFRSSNRLGSIVEADPCAPLAPVNPDCIPLADVHYVCRADHSDAGSTVEPVHHRDNLLIANQIIVR